MPADTLVGRRWDTLQASRRHAQRGGEAADTADADVLASLGAHDGLASDPRALGEFVLGKCALQADRS